MLEAKSQFQLGDEDIIVFPVVGRTNVLGRLAWWAIETQSRPYAGRRVSEASRTVALNRLVAILARRSIRVRVEASQQNSRAHVENEALARQLWQVCERYILIATVAPNLIRANGPSEGRADKGKAVAHVAAVALVQVAV